MYIWSQMSHDMTVWLSWWRHQMETCSALLAICAGNSPVPGEFPSQRPVTRSFDVFFDLRVNKGFSKQSRGWWFETLSSSSWRHSNGRSPLAKLRFYCYGFYWWPGDFQHTKSAMWKAFFFSWCDYPCDNGTDTKLPRPRRKCVPLKYLITVNF